MTGVLVISTLFPNAVHKNHGIFVENRLKKTLERGLFTAAVLAPVPYFPFRGKFWGRYGEFARVPVSENRDGIKVVHPRYLVLPKLGTNLTPRFLFNSFRAAAEKLKADGVAIDAIDAHYFYPDGVAAAMLARELKVPLAITARGSDLTLLATFDSPRRQIVWAASQADALIAVSQSLKDVLVELGVDGAKIAVLRNGVDTAVFEPRSRLEARTKLGVTRFSIVSVGALIPRKGHELTVAAMRDLPQCELIIVGHGPLRAQFMGLAREHGVEQRVRFVGEVPHQDLALYYNAADVMVLMSDREGWANVILESVACGTPVIATNVGGAGEIIRSPVAGRLLAERSVEALVREIKSLREDMPRRDATRRYAESFSWDAVACANSALLLALSQRALPANISDAYSVLGPDRRA